VSYSIFDFPAQAREHNERMEKERFNSYHKNMNHTFAKLPDGKQVAPGVYQQGNMLIVGDKY